MNKDRCLSHSLCHRVYMLDIHIRDEIDTIEGTCCEDISSNYSLNVQYT